MSERLGAGLHALDRLIEIGLCESRSYGRLKRHRQLVWILEFVILSHFEPPDWKMVSSVTRRCRAL